MTGLFTITSSKSGEEKFKVFGLREGDDSFASGRIIFSHIWVFPDGAKHCTCTFIGRQNCDRHHWKDIGFFNPKTQEITVFSKLKGRMDDDGYYVKSEEEKYAALFTFLLKRKHEVCDLLEAVPCTVCGELLTNPVSIRNGIGPICAERGM